MCHLSIPRWLSRWERSGLHASRRGAAPAVSRSAWGLALHEFGLVADEAKVIYSLSSAQGVMPCVFVNRGRSWVDQAKT